MGLVNCLFDDKALQVAKIGTFFVRQNCLDENSLIGRFPEWEKLKGGL
jgi:hypothetical protein